MNKILMSGLVSGSLVLMASLSPAQAALELTLFDGTTTVVVPDGSGLDDNTTAGVITYNGPLGVWDVNVTTGVGSPPLGPGQMHLNTVNVSSTGPGTLEVLLSQSGFTGPSSMSTLIGGTTAGNVTYNTYIDPGNGLGINGKTDLLTTMSFVPGVIAGTAGASISDPSYSVTQDVLITHARGTRTTSLDADLTVPEPTTMIAGALLLLPFGLSTARLLRRKAA